LFEVNIWVSVVVRNYPKRSDYPAGSEVILSATFYLLHTSRRIDMPSA